MLLSGAWGKVIHEKKQKISWHCPFKKTMYTIRHTAMLEAGNLLIQLHRRHKCHKIFYGTGYRTWWCDIRRFLCATAMPQPEERVHHTTLYFSTFFRVFIFYCSRGFSLLLTCWGEWQWMERTTGLVRSSIQRLTDSQENLGIFSHCCTLYCGRIGNVRTGFTA